MQSEKIALVNHLAYFTFSNQVASLARVEERSEDLEVSNTFLRKWGASLLNVSNQLVSPLSGQ